MTENTAIGSADALDGIPLPPKEMWDELAGSGGGQAEGPAPGPTQVAREVAELEFIGDVPPFKAFTLVYPFRYAGREVREIVVRRLTVQQVGDFWDQLPADGAYDRTDVYGLMCGLPGAVLRALPDTDGIPITGACFDFLPRALGGEND